MTQAAPLPRRPSALPDVHGLRVPERTLPLLRDLVNAETGMFYDDARLDFLQDRLAPLAIERGFDSLLDYYYLLRYDDDAPREWVKAIDALSVQETYFWREFDQMRALTEGILPQLVACGRTPIRIWSIPCASGEEPLSIAIALEEAGWFDRARIEIHAADASELALRRAAAGQYSSRSFRQLPLALRDKYFERGVDDAHRTIKPAIRDRISSWSRVNVVRRDQTGLLPSPDVIFCRNLFIYFTEATVKSVVDTFADAMPSPGFLCVGAAESLLRVTVRFELREIAGAYVYVKP